MVSSSMREHPTLPACRKDPQIADTHALREDVAVDLPKKHCAFRGCTAEAKSDAELIDHLLADSKHSLALSAVTRKMPVSQDDERVRMFSAYCEALALKVRQGPPLDTYSIDRRAILNYNSAAADDQIHSLICFSCARRFPHMKCLGDKNEIAWQRPVTSREDTSFFGMSPQHCADIYGLDKYMERYGHQEGFPDMRQHMEEFADWQYIVPYHPQPLTILCCPEDRICRSSSNASCLASHTLCDQCEIPVCSECTAALVKPDGPSMPGKALTNDLMIFYAPAIIYEKQVTVMELICASTCMTTMISFTLEKKFRGKEQRLFDQPVHMQRHTVGTRGNATSFPMPWEEILRMLKDVDEESDGAAGLDLPHSGEELVRWVQVLLKTSGDNSEDDMKGLVHQASVRADVVVALIEELKRRGHRAYKNLDMARVRSKAENTLPRHGIPPEILHLIKIKDDDDSLDRIQVQKEATPVPGRCQSDAEAAQIFKDIAPNAVVCERSTADGVDVVAQRAAAFQDIGAQLEKGSQQKASKRGTAKAAKISVSTGNSMIDQFKPWCHIFWFNRQGELRKYESTFTYMHFPSHVYIYEHRFDTVPHKNGRVPFSSWQVLFLRKAGVFEYTKTPKSRRVPGRIVEFPGRQTGSLL